ncbi:hypothetical protein E2320_001136 [Naja naja]|nr:hypothetical protein E2320_001136 [Naja naja]
MDTCRLPVEVIAYILSFLSISDRKVASLVNRTWYFAAQESLRQNVLYNIPAASASLGTIRALAERRVCDVKMVNLDSSTTSRDVIQCIANYLGPHLRSLCLNGSCLTEASFEELLLACPNLVALDLSCCNSIFMSGALLSKKETLSQAREALANLRELNLASVRYLSDLTFNHLTSCCPQLAKLVLARCHLTFEFDSYSGSHDYNSSALLSFRNLLHFLGQRAASVKHLDLSGTNINGQSMRTLVQVENLQLQEFVLQACQDLTNEAVSTLCQYQPYLTMLDLSGCSELSDRAGLAIHSRLLDLRSLRLGKLPRMTDAGFQGVSHLKHLQSLDVSECSLVSCSELVKAFGKSTRPPKLKSLNVAFCSLLRDSTVLSLAEVLSRNLQVLDLSSCVSLSNRSIQAISSSLLLLTVLRLAWYAGPKFSRNFGNMGFFLPPTQDLEQDKMAVVNLNQQKAQEQRQTSLNALTHLRYLSLSLVPNITDTSLLAIVRNCRSLEHLSLSHCTSLTDRGFAEAAGSLCRLQHLVLSGCNQLTPRTLKSIGQECKLLKSLDVSMCSKISMSDVEHFQSQLPPQSQTSIHSRFVGGADLSITL